MALAPRLDLEDGFGSLQGVEIPIQLHALLLWRQKPCGTHVDKPRSAASVGYGIHT